MFPDAIILLHIFGVVEVIIALWILSGKYIFIPSTLAALMLLGIVVFNIPQMDVLFRDVSILLMAVTLMLLHKPTKESAPDIMA